MADDGKALPGLIRLDVAGVAVHIRGGLTLHDIRVYRGWRAAHPHASGLRARAFLLARVLVDPATGGRLYTSEADVIAALDPGFILAASAKVMSLVPDN